MDRAGTSGATRLRALPSGYATLPPIHHRRRGIAIAASVVAVVALAPALTAIRPLSVWAPQGVFVLLLTLFFISDNVGLRVGRYATLDTGFVLIQATLALFGPIPAFCLLPGPTAAACLTGKTRFVAWPANLAADGWGIVAAGLALQATSATWPMTDASITVAIQVTLAGIAFLTTNWALITAWGILHDGNSLKTAVTEEFVGYGPTTLALCVTGGAIVLAYNAFGIVGLLPLAIVAALPALRFPFWRIQSLPEDQSVASLIALYAQNLATVLRLDRSQKEILREATTHLSGNPRVSRIERFHDVMRVVLFAGARWDGESDFPLLADAIPIESRILSVAIFWADLSAADGQALSQEQALIELKARTGTEFDPDVVAAAVEILEGERLPQPRPEKVSLQRNANFA